MARTRGEEDYVAGSDLDLLTVRPSDQQPCPAFRDPENLVRTAMVMVMGKDAVAPQAAPTIGPEAFFYPCGSIFRNVDRLTIDQDRQARVIWYAAAFGEHELFDFHWFSPRRRMFCFPAEPGTNSAAVCFLQSCRYKKIARSTGFAKGENEPGKDFGGEPR